MTGQSRNILHVDDDANFTRMLAARLAKHGLWVEAINDPADALDRIMRGNYRIVLLDIHMPELDGMELLRQIKQYDGGIQVIILTGIVTMSSVLESLRWGAEACFFKPLDDEQPLVAAVEDAYRKLTRWWEALESLSQRRRRQDRQGAEETATSLQLIDDATTG